MPTDAYLEHRILSADPVELIQILYEHGIKLVREARSALAAGDIVARSKALSRTIGILGELEGSLDREVAGTISQNLAALYQYMRGRLTAANIKQEDGPLAEVESLMQTLSGAWKAIRPMPGDAPGADTPATPAQEPAQINGPQFLPDSNSASAAHSWTA